jgi:hypothetical protein
MKECGEAQVSRYGSVEAVTSPSRLRIRRALVTVGGGVMNPKTPAQPARADA